MEIRSLGYRTDLIFPRFDGELIDRGDYLVIRTPSNPLYYWGNFLLFRDAPKPGDFQRWTGLFAREIGTRPETQHIVLGWDSSTGEIGEVQSFLSAGFNLSQNVVLTAQSLNPPKHRNTEVDIRPIKEDWEWQAAIENQIACRPEEHNEEGYRKFKEMQFDRYQKMTEAGLGHWFGAFLGDQIVADLGIYRDQEIGRFQAVETHPAHRNRGICGTLVSEAGQYAFCQMGIQTLVMIADEFYHAARIYESVGFLPTEKQVGLEWW